MVLEKKIFESHQCIFAISIPSPYPKGHDPSFKKLESLSHKDALCQVSLKLAKLLRRRKIIWLLIGNTVTKFMYLIYYYFVVMGSGGGDLFLFVVLSSFFIFSCKFVFGYGIF